MVAKLTVTPQPGLDLKDGGWSCSTDLLDDRGNSWSQGNTTSDWELPTTCFSTDDVKFEIGKPAKLGQVFVVPATAVAHVVGLSIQDRDEFRRVLITP